MSEVLFSIDLHQERSHLIWRQGCNHGRSNMYIIFVEKEYTRKFIKVNLACGLVGEWGRWYFKIKITCNHVIWLVTTWFFDNQNSIIYPSNVFFATETISICGTSGSLDQHEGLYEGIIMSYFRQHQCILCNHVELVKELLKENISEKSFAIFVGVLFRFCILVFLYKYLYSYYQ